MPRELNAAANAPAAASALTEVSAEVSAEVSVQERCVGALERLHAVVAYADSLIRKGVGCVVFTGTKKPVFEDYPACSARARAKSPRSVLSHSRVELCQAVTQIRHALFREFDATFIRTYRCRLFVQSTYAATYAEALPLLRVALFASTSRHAFQP
eukprot:5499349-Pleurochrysis_carterae.AAC.1